MCIYVDFDDTDTVAQYLFNLLQDGVHHFAGLAPGCKEIDQHELIASYYVVKCFHSYCVFCLLLVEK